MKRLTLLFFLLWTIITYSQEQHFSIHYYELKKYDSIGDRTPEFWRQYFGYKKLNINDNTKGCRLNHIVFGWHPYWVNGLEDNYQWSYLSDLAYFSYEVDPATGDPLSTHSWETASVVDKALSHGVRVHLTATLFGNHDQFFGNPSAVQNLINNLVSKVAQRNANGINIDFEGMGSDNKDDFTQFIADLRSAMDNVDTNWILSICLYAVDWNGVFDIPNLVPNVDYFTIMGYDYYYKGSSEAGPTGQLYKMSSFNYTQSRSVTYYKHKGVPNSKLVLGVPYYGFDWPTSSSSVPSSTTGNGTTKTIKTVKANYTNPHIEPNSLSEYYVYYDSNNSTWRQCWVDDETTMKYKYKMVLQQGIAGIGIWALGYDDGYTQMWDLIRDYFSECAVVPCRDTIWDLGGPTRDHYNNESFIYTIEPTGAKGLSLEFTDFSLEAGYDSLYIYDGNSISSPLIGGYSGNNSPGTITATGNALTLKFHSDGATVKPGFTAIWQCTPDDINPTTAINSPDWISNDFTANYTDHDNIKVKYRFYQAIDYNGTEWRANNNYGYLYDDFSQTSLNTEWNNAAGNWYITNGYLRQDDQSSSNTNLYINLTQDTSHIYLYSWKMRIGGSGSNRRAGFHFFCSDPTQSGRENSYMVYFRVDNNTAQIYKYVNNSYNLMVSEPCNVDADTWYDYKVIFNAKTGEIYAFQNDVLVAKWIDPDPWTQGGYLSLRTGNAITDYDDIKVYKSRTDNTLITVGANKEFRYENPSQNQPAGRIYSIVADENYNFSDVALKEVNVDTTAPSTVSCLTDKSFIGIDTTYGYIAAHWCQADEPQSYVVRYWYAIGTSPLDSNVYSWHSTVDTFIVLDNLNFVNDEIYYVSVKAENICGLIGNAVSSDGVVVLLLPQANVYLSDTVICQNQAISFRADTSNIDSFNWKIQSADTTIFSEESSPVITFSLPGTYSVKLVVCNSNGCDSVFYPNLITVMDRPSADFTAENTQGQAPLLVHFINNTTGSSQNYLWNFGDGYTSDEINPVHSYNVPGVYTVSLVATNENCSDTISKLDYINVFAPTYIVSDGDIDLVIYPNPVGEVLYLSYSDKKNYQVLDMQGTVIQSGVVVDGKIDISHLSDGMYILKVGKWSYKLIKR